MLRTVPLSHIENCAHQCDDVMTNRSTVTVSVDLIRSEFYLMTSFSVLNSTD